MPLNSSVFTLDLELDIQTVIFVRNIINYVITPILSVIGVVGNVINLVVLRQSGYKDTNVLLLESLSMADLILSLLNILLRTREFVQQFGAIIYIYSYGPFVIMAVVVNCHLGVIAVERVIAVCFPFHVSRIFIRSRVKLSIGFIYVFCIGTYSPLFFMFEPLWVNNQTAVVIVPSQIFLSNMEAIIVYLTTVAVNIYSITLPAIVIICSLFVGVKLLMRKLQLPMHCTQRRSKDLSAMKMILSVCLLVLFNNGSCLGMNYFFQAYALTEGPLYDLLKDLLTLIDQLNTSFNFFVYVAMSKKFLKTYRNFLSKCFQNKN
ncbi:FMRFamide receptor-like [Biomphalaria glabrata]|uniref:FMRFamide receptor-like n=1 Tax=Biomphalaria glabrata TaxID=6526 RepID=A0A9U8EM91_BIOGL|nr:FMRFamide receptor-like [Biomphalaria glabrata]